MRHTLSNHRVNLQTIASWAMFSRGLAPEFSQAVLKQVESLTGPARDKDPNIRDLTGMPWCSIDNDDSHDLDQLTAIEPLDARGGVKVYVAIADVDALVRKGSAIDEHARFNTTSVYTSACVFPMLPERLCYDLTSLSPGQDRLALIVEMQFSNDAQLVRFFIYRALVHNKVQLAYDALAEWIEGRGEFPEVARHLPGMKTQIRMQDELAQKLRVLRRAKGSLEFETFQPKALFQQDHITDIVQQVQNRARQLIEELMIATNGCTARFLAEHGSVSFRRVVRSPERWQRIVEVAQAYGVTLPRQPDGQALEAFLADQHQSDPLRFPDLSLVIVKLMGSGEYVVERPHEVAIGHFGLAVRDYMHSTAPNRRFPDLLTLRLLKALLQDQPSPYSDQELDVLALHCTTQEDAAQKVERQVRKSEAALLLHSRIGHEFSGVITGTGDHGLWVRIFQPPAEGRLKEPGSRLRVGELVRVKLVRTSVERGFIDFVLTR